MAIPLRSPDEIEGLSRAGALCWSILDRLVSACRAGVMTAQIDGLARREVERAGAVPLFPGYAGHDGRRPFPTCVCVSINEELVHGIPGERLIRAGDVVSIDLGLSFAGWCADAARTVLVEPVRDEHGALHAGLLEVLGLAIERVGPGVRWSEVVQAVGERARERGLTLVEPYAGHGIGRALHEPPRAPLLNPVESGGGPLALSQDFVLRPGMVLTVEPIVVRGRGTTITATDGWTVLASDRAIGCHEERMVAIVRGGSRMLTAAPIRSA